MGLIVCLHGVCFAQWDTQDIELNPGWNAVYLEVQPTPAACDAVFTNAAIQGIWKWDRRFSTIEYAVDPDTRLPENPHWLTWLPPSSTNAFLRRLLVLQGCQSYLVKVDTNAISFTVPVKGQVMMPQVEWFPHSLNLVGFPINPVNPPTFSSYLKYTPEIDTSLGFHNELYRIDAAGRGITIVQPARENIEPGTAYWIKCANAPKYMAPIDVSPLVGLVFGRVLSQIELALYNPLPSNDVTARVVQRNSESAPTGDYPELAGSVPLSYLARNASNRWEWNYWPVGGLTETLSPGETWTVYIGVRRGDMAVYTPTGTNGFIYASILEVVDEEQSVRICVPVSAEKSETPLPDHNEYEGLWVGDVILDKVTAPAFSTTNLLATTAPCVYRVIMHVDGYGQPRLLKQVMLAWDSSLTNAPHTNGTYALFVDADDVPADAAEVHRITSAAFPLMDPVLLAGSMTGTLNGTVTVLFDDPTNPFLHRYQPMHDNQNWDFEPYTNAVETYTVTRELEMVFSGAQTNDPANPYWSGDSLSGNIVETYTGLRAQDILTSGSFQLQRISRISELQ